MITDDFLITHAYQNVWCAPEQDRQHILRPARITPKVGAKGSIAILWTTFNLPTQGERYHVFQFGNMAQVNLGLNLKHEVWTSASSQMVDEMMTVDVYGERGLIVPRQYVYFLRTRDDNLTVAIKHLPVIGDFGYDDVYFRFYTNVFFNRLDQPDPVEGIEYKLGVPANTSQINQLMYHLREMQGRSGYVFCYVNGWRVNDINTATVMRGDIVEMVRDSSVDRVEEFRLEDLPVFYSELDQSQKYLIHPAREDDDFIAYRDDQDIYLMHKSTPHIHKGVYFHKNMEDSLRMVTHRDYSMRADYVDRLLTENGDWTVSNQLTVQLVLRKSGMDKPLIDEAHHIRDLYKLPDPEWLSAIIGSEAVVDVWRVEELEKSAYTAIMRAKAGQVTREMVESAYGYNSITKIVADTPQKVPAPKAWVELPYGLRGESTVYEYNAQGHLLSWYRNQNVQWYVPRSEHCAYIEAISGRGTDVLTTVYGKDATLPKGLSYRCYTCPIANGYPTGEWQDVTGNEDYYHVVDGKVMWLVNRNQVYTAVKFDDTFLTYDLVLDYQDALLRFSLNVKELRINGIVYNGLLEIPGGLLEIWLNGRSLIENLDWFQVDGEIVIVNRGYRNQVGTSNRITIRSTGFCTTEMKRVRETEFGWVENGILSRNNRWNLRDDKVFRVIADGRLYSRDELSWAEDKPEVVLTNVRNGAPYQVTEPLIPLRGLTERSAYDLHDEAEATDIQIEDYMTTRVPDIPTPEVNLIPDRHSLYSPFVGKILHDLMSGYFDQIPLDDYYSDQDVRTWCARYDWLLKYEPTRKGFDDRYVTIDAHERTEPFHLNIFHYNFLARVIKVILDDKIDITHMVKIDHLPI